MLQSLACRASDFLMFSLSVSYFLSLGGRVALALPRKTNPVAAFFPFVLQKRSASISCQLFFLHVFAVPVPFSGTLNQN